MGAPAAGRIVLVRFPFSDLSATKLRPALSIAQVGNADSILVQITNNPYGDTSAISIGKGDFASGSLHRDSYARPGKLFTCHESLVEREVASLSDERLREVIDAIASLLRSARP